MGTGQLLSTITFDLPAWALLCWLIVRILRTGDNRLWLVAGLVTGLGLFDSDLVASLAAAVLAGLALTGPRWPFRSVFFYPGAVIALLLWVPYLSWQAAHGRPQHGAQL
jgi:hypothetical protein